jgi:CDP-glycerol glycerophosphotransferase (TagB/SpsB family)/phosphorylcholine metabolism protein LicD
MTESDIVAAGRGPGGESMLRGLQLVELDVLRELARRCDAASVRWFVVGGTLLGAVRHQGFIPWDDDIDVAMPRPDYDRFEALCRRSTDPSYTWQSCRTDPAYPFAYGKLGRSGTIARELAVSHLPVRQPIHVDVFVLDGAPESLPARGLHALGVKLAVTALGARIRRTGVRRALASPLRLVPRSWSIRLLDRLARTFPYDRSPRVVNAAGAWGYSRECQPRRRFEPATTLEFEGLAVPAPGRWHEYLSRVYGDYQRLPPPEQRRPRHDRDMVDLGDGRGPTGSSPGGRQPSGRRRLRAAAAWLGIAVARLGFLVGCMRRPRPYIVFATRDPATIAGNLRFIRLELERRRLGIPVRVVGYRTRPGLRGRLTSAWEAARVGYHLAAARAFVADDWLFPVQAVWPRRGTTRVQVWHAAGAFKRFGFSLVGDSSGTDDEMLRRVPMTSNYDLCLVSSVAATGAFSEAFRMPPERLVSSLGLPRTDALLDPAYQARATEAIRSRYGLPTDRKLLLYAPTFRGEDVHEARYDDTLDLATMRDALDPDWLLLLRMHPHVGQRTRLGPDVAGFVVDVSDWPEMTDLLPVADLLLTDYSSAIFEYSLLGRPMAFLAPDLDAYQVERGFYIDVPGDLPGPVFESTEALAAYVAAGQFDTGRSRAFARRWFDVADGRAAERFVSQVVLPAVRGERPRIGVTSADQGESARATADRF